MFFLGRKTCSWFMCPSVSLLPCGTLSQLYFFISITNGKCAFGSVRVVFGKHDIDSPSVVGKQVCGTRSSIGGTQGKEHRSKSR